MTTARLSINNGYTLTEIENKLSWANRLLLDLVESIDDIEKGHTLQKAARIENALVNARFALGITATPPQGKI